MIGQLNGLVQSCTSSYLLINVNNIGFNVHVYNPEAYTQNQQVKLFIYTHFSQDKGFELYGFQSTLEKEVFTLVISCSGLGPKMGLTVLSSLQPEDFISAISLGDARILSSVNGIGKKKAELMIMHLKDKVSDLSTEVLGKSDKSTHVKNLNQVAEALSSLNYAKPEIKQALEHIKEHHKENFDKFDFILRKALSFLAKKA